MSSINGETNIDFEGDDISEKLRNYEKELVFPVPYVNDADEAKRIAKEQYERDKRALRH